MFIATMIIMAIGFAIHALFLFLFHKKLYSYSVVKERKINLYLLRIWILVLAILFFISSMNALVLSFNLWLAVWIGDIISRIAKKIRKKEIKSFFAEGLCLCFMICYLLFGVVSCFQVKQTKYDLNNEKMIGSLRLAQIADVHLGTTFDGAGFEQHLQEIQEQSPDILVITGDFVDDSSQKEDMIIACKALGNFTAPYGVYYVFGNHDKGYGNSRDFTYDDLVTELKKNNVVVMEDSSLLIANQFYLIGRKDKSDANRLELSQLMQEIDREKMTIVLDHQPNDYDAEEATGADLVLSGHTHGGQMFPIGLLGEWFAGNDATWGMEKRSNTTFVVTSGISDWEFWFKTGTYSEYVILDINKKTN